MAQLGKPTGCYFTFEAIGAPAPELDIIDPGVPTNLRVSFVNSADLIDGDMQGLNDFDGQSLNDG